MIHYRNVDPLSGMNLDIRNETQSDYAEVEKITRAAFWNLYVPGCVEHYLIHQLRPHADFIPSLDLVLTLDSEIIGSIMYTKATLVDDGGKTKGITTFGPLCIKPEYQRRGYGKLLIETSFALAHTQGFDTVVIFGMPGNYVARGFKCCADLGVAMPNGQYPTAMLVKELVPGALAGHKWQYHESPAMEVDMAAVEDYDRTLPPLPKQWQPSQEEFNIISRSTLSSSESEQ
jgi:predicted N-acetyltransferase YhbS